MIKNSFIVISKLFIGLWIPRQYISIVIPVYEMKGNGETYLKELLETIFSQKYSNYEIVISDDSKDEVLHQYILTLPRSKRTLIKYYKNQGVKGISSNLNNAIRQAKGQIIKVMFQDDFFTSKKALLSLHKAYSSFPNVNWIIESSINIKAGVKSPASPPKFNHYLLLGINTIGSPSTISFKKNNIIKFDENLIMLMDVEMYIRLMIVFGPPLIIDSKNIANRIWNGQAQNEISHDQYYSEVQWLRERYSNIITSNYLNSAITNSLSIDGKCLRALKLLSHSLKNDNLTNLKNGN